MTTGRKTSAVLTALALASGGVLTLGGGASAAPGGALVYGLTLDNRLLSFRAESLVTDNGVAISGLMVGEDVVGIDVRPRTGELVGVVQSPTRDRLISIDPSTGASTAIDTLDVQLAGSVFGVDMNPQADALRIVSNNGQNLRHSFASSTTFADETLTYGSGEAPQVTGAAYTNNVDGTASTQLFDIDTARDLLVRQDPPNAGTLVSVGALNAGGDVLSNTGFDVDAATGTAYASLQTPTGVGFFTVDLATGAATRRGALPNTVEDVAVATPRFAVAASTVTEGQAAQVVVRRTGDLTDPATVDYVTSSGSATEGSDYTRTSGTLSFAPREASKTVSVPTSLQGGLEGQESFTVVLSNPTGGSVLSPASGTVTITDAENGQLYALLTNNALRTLPVNDPGASGTTVPVTGLAPGDDLVGIDLRPATGELYGVGSSGRLYVIEPRTGVAQTRGNAITPALAGTSFGVDVNPAVDRLRIVSNNGQNLRVNPVTGDTIVDTPLSYAAGDRNATVTPAVSAAGYTDNVAGTPTTTLLDIDTATDSLVRQDPPNGGVLNTVGPLGLALGPTSVVGLDVGGLGGNAFAALQPEGVVAPALYRVDTERGTARLLGAFSTTGGTVEDLALAPATTPTPTPTATATSTPSATPTATTSASPTPSATSSSPAPGQLSVSVDPAVIVPTRVSRVTVTGRPGSVVELQAYSRPDTEYDVVREGIIPASGRIVFDVTPGTNTRLMAQVKGFPSTASPSVVINVRTALSLTVVRNGTRDYTFQGRILPRRAGQLITLYRVDGDRRIITNQIKTDSTGTYRINRKFTGSGTFGFLTRTGQNLTNAAGESNTKPEDVESGKGTVRPTAIF